MRQAGLVELRLHLARDQGVGGGRAAATGHVGHLDAGLELQHLAEQVGDGGKPRRAEVDLARVGLGVGHELRDGACRHRRMDGEDAPAEVHMRDTVTKSLSGSNGIGCGWRVMQTIAVVVVRKVWLSTAWFFTNSPPIMPEAPGFVVEHDGLAEAWAARSMTMRVETSDGPPGG